MKSIFFIIIIGASQSETHINHTYKKFACTYVCIYVCIYVSMYVAICRPRVQHTVCGLRVHIAIR